MKEHTKKTQKKYLNKIEAAGEHQKFNQEMFWKWPKERIENALYNFPERDLEQEEGPKTLNGGFFFPNLVNFIIHFIIRGGMTHCHISPTAPSDSIHI